MPSSKDTYLGGLAAGDGIAVREQDALNACVHEQVFALGYGTRWILGNGLPPLLIKNAKTTS